MYENFYGLREKPFSLLPDPEYLYLSEKHQMALTLLEYGVLNQAGFCVISGQAGAGKTTLIRHLLGRFGDDISVGLLSNTHESFGELLTWILMSFGLEYTGKTKTELYQTFVDFVIDQYAQNRYTLLIVDEAQNISLDTLEELRMLSNVNADKDQVLQVILVGQPKLLENLQRPELEQFAQRIAVDYNLEALNKEETQGYIQHRLNVAGGSPELFEAEVCDLVYRHSGGIPRLINMLCDTALVYGYAEQANPISARIVADVIKEREKHGVLPKFRETEQTDEPVAANKAVRINKKNAKTASKTKDKQKLSAEAPLVASAAGAAASRGEASIQLVSGAASVSNDDAVAVTPQNQAEYVARAIELNKKSAAMGNSKTTSKDINDEVLSKNKNDEKSKASIGVKKIESPEEIPDEKIEGSSGSTGGSEDNLIDDIGSDGGQKEPIDLVNEERLSPNSDIIPLHMQSIKSNSKMGFGVIGFAFGLVLSAAVLFFAMYEDDPATREITKGETSAADSGARFQENEFKLKAEALKRERDAALAEARALQRERDAAIAVAKAQEDVRQAELKATRARQNELRTAAKAQRARERARAAIVEAEAARQSEQQAALEAAKAQEEKERAVQMMNMGTAEPVQPESVQLPGANNELIDQQIPTMVGPKAGNPATAESSNNEKPGRFSPDPCKGPSAVFLSTCKK